MIGPAGFMAAPHSSDSPAPARERWDVSNSNPKGVAHWWIDSPSHPDRVRSQCGLVEERVNLQGLSHELSRCKRCQRGKLRAEIQQAAQNAKYVRDMRKLNASDSEIASALGIPVDSPVFMQ